MDAVLSSVWELVRKYQPSAVEMRRYLHAHPELSGEERGTAAFVAEKLREFGIPFEEYLDGTGIVGYIRGENPKKTVVALRADMDALPIAEATNLPFSSQNPGVMHACGHDFHTANLLGTALVLNELRSQFSGTAMLIFQPSEEKIPSGAERMLQAGIFENVKPKSIIALHVDPDIETGTIGTRKGAFLASADELFITIHGKGGHGAYPQQCVDPIVIAAQTIMALQTLVSRNANPLNPTVVNIGRIEGLGRTNVIPNEVTLAGTIRVFDNEWRENIHRRIVEIVESTAKAYGGSATIEIKKGYPPLFNDEKLTQSCMENLQAVFGAEHIIESPMRMGADDFSYFAEKFPAAYLRLGVRNETKKTTAPLHADTFDLDEDAFEIGMTAMAWLALRSL